MNSFSFRVATRWWMSALAGLCCMAATGAEPDNVSSRRILAGDRLNISVQEQADLSRVYAVAGDGSIDFSFAGRVLIAELTADEAARKLEEVLEKSYFKDAHVSISIANFVEGDVLVQGAVQNPGLLTFRGDSILTLVEAIARCGGLTDRAAGDRVRILRWMPGGSMEKQSIEVDVQAMFDTLDFSKDQYLRPRDMIVVPARGREDGRKEFLAMGEVKNPGYHLYSENLDVIKAVSMVGGLGEFADWGAARIMRLKSGDEWEIIPLNLTRLFSAADMSVNLPLQRGDIFFVPSIRNEVRAQVFLLGEVKSPGAASLTPGLDASVAKLIVAKGGLTEFARAGAVQVQRMGPDGTKKVLQVDVERILKNGTFEDDVPLQDGDVIVVPDNKLFGVL